MPDTPVILHLSLPVHDLDEARGFYVDVLGCELGRTRDEWIDVWFFGMQLTLQRRPQEVHPSAEQGVRHFGVAFAERSGFDALVERLRACEVPWITPPTMHRDGPLSGKTEVKVADPSGNVIEIKHYPDPAAHHAGRAPG